MIEFTSERKRMTVIVRNTKGTIKVLSKGADSVMTPRLNNDIKNQQIFENTRYNMEDFANNGLRTLMIC